MISSVWLPFLTAVFLAIGLYTFIDVSVENISQKIKKVVAIQRIKKERKRNEPRKPFVNTR
ncbi:hypothetical protein [Desertibacillus haloalkaliphilus]|uniref:hypothetical protein n=1 Tax=Desertibacillus haloalkaliphilus TaxID=1328930 RepID=UPI001C269E8D|nr:hypothetical protein [Desertibacillus haloalkaliphilus]MBU8905584.1 hypothetical protein [Desertibacillus haloalkaliphilus]